MVGVTNVGGWVVVEVVAVPPVAVVPIPPGVVGPIPYPAGLVAAIIAGGTGGCSCSNWTSSSELPFWLMLGELLENPQSSENPRFANEKSELGEVGDPLDSCSSSAMVSR